MDLLKEHTGKLYKKYLSAAFGSAMIISVARGMVISGALNLRLPVLVGANAIWFAMPVTELVVCIYAVVQMRKNASVVA